MESQKDKEEARSNTLNPNSRCMTGHSNLNQPLNIYPAMNETFPTGSGNEGHYSTIDDAFNPLSEYNMDTAFVMDHHEYDRTRQTAYHREMLEHQRMADKLSRGYHFSDRY